MSRTPFEFIIEGDCPQCNTPLEFCDVEILSGEGNCPKCKTQIQLKNCNNKKIFQTANLLEGYCTSCRANLVFSDNDRKSGIVFCPGCGQRFFLWESSSYTREENVDRLIELIDNCIKEHEDLERIISLLNITIELIKKNFYKVIKLIKKRSGIGKGVAWTAAILTGGIGLEDLIIVPAVNYSIQKILGGKLEKVLKDFMVLVYNKIFKIAESGKVLSDDELTVLFSEAYLYLIISEINDQEIFLYQLETYSFEDNYSQDIPDLVEKVNAIFNNSIKRDLDHMVVFWLSLARIISFKYPNAPFLKKIYFYYNQSHYNEESSYSNEEDEFLTDENLSKYEKILGVKWNGNNFDDIKKQYRILVNKYHPDKNNNDAKKFMEVQEAYIYFKQKKVN